MYRKPDIILRTPAAINFFHQILKKRHFGVKKKKKLLPTQMDLYSHMWSPTLFPRKIIIFQGVLKKFRFLMEFPHLKKNCRFNESPQI